MQIKLKIMDINIEPFKIDNFKSISHIIIEKERHLWNTYIKKVLIIIP